MLGTCLSYRRNPGKLYSPGATMFLIGGKTLRQEITAAPAGAGVVRSHRAVPDETRALLYTYASDAPALCHFFATGFAQQPVKSSDHCGLRPRREIHGLQHDPAGVRHGRPAQLAVGRSLLVSGDPRERRGIHPGGPGKRHTRPGVRSRPARGIAFARRRMRSTKPARSRFRRLTLAEDGSTVSFSAAGKGWKCALADYQCAQDASAAATRRARRTRRRRRRRARRRRRSRRAVARQEDARLSSATTTSGCATWRPARKRSSPPTA